MEKEKKTKVKNGMIILAILLVGIMQPIQATSNNPPTLDYYPQEYDFGNRDPGYIGYTKLYIWSGGTCGDEMLVYTLNWKCPWVIASPTNGSCTCGEINIIQIKIDTTKLSPGKHTCIILIDSNGGTGQYTISVRTKNNPPLTPEITGKRIGREKTNYTYQALTTDPEEDNIYYNFSWGDGTYSEWLGPYPSGEPATSTHQWPPGVHTIQVKARDEQGAESNWSNPVSLIMPTYTIRPIIKLIEKIIQWELIPLRKL